MRASRLVKLFLNLETKELTRFRSYLKSEGTGYAMDAQLLMFDYLKTNAKKKVRTGPGYEDLLDEAVVQRSLSKKNKSIKPTNMNRIKSGLYKNLTDAIIYYQLEKERSDEDNLQRKMILIRYLKNKLSNNSEPNKDLSDLYTSTIQDLHDSKKSMNKKTSFDYLDLHVLNDNLYFNVDTNAWAAGEAMNDLHDSIDLYYCLTKLKYCTEVMVRQLILNEKSAVRLKREVRLIANEFTDNSAPLIQMYARCFDLFNNSKFDEANLMALISLIKKHLHLDTSELAIIINFATNYIFIAKKENSTFSKVSYELLKIAFEKDIFMDEGFLEPDKLINYAFMCTRHGDGHKIPEILEAHLNQVKNKKDGQRDKTEIICRAYHLFSIQRFAQAFELLFNKRFRNEPYFMHLRTLRIKSIYEAEKQPIGKFDFFDRTDTLKECDRFIQAMENRREVYNLNTVYERNINFVEMVAKLYRYTQDTHATATQKNTLMSELHTLENIAYREWLQLKIMEL